LPSLRAITPPREPAEAYAILPTEAYAVLPTRLFAQLTAPLAPNVPLAHVTAPSEAAAPLVQMGLATT
jgi:hypothetical protein